MWMILLKVHGWVNDGRRWTIIVYSLLGLCVLSLALFIGGSSRLGEPGYDEGVTRPLRAVGRALTLEEASAALDRVLAYGCAHGFNSGPSDDVVVWYGRLRAARERTAAAEAGATPQMREMLLVNVRNAVERAELPHRLEYAYHRGFFLFWMAVMGLSFGAMVAFFIATAVLSEALKDKGLIARH